ncbi:MAG: hypothetical protein AAGH15_12840, partial [Myxococcota bacterium]
LDVSRNALPSLAGLEGRTLAWLDASRNALSDVGALLSVAGLEELNVRQNRIEAIPPALARRFPAAFGANPGHEEGVWKLHLADRAEARRRERERALAEATGPRAPALPGGTLRLRGRSLHVVTAGEDWSATGTVDEARGRGVLALGQVDPVRDIGTGKLHPAPVRVVVRSREGRVRLFLRPRGNEESGFPFADAAPGQPARLRGRLVRDALGFGVVLEVLDGVARGLEVEVTPTP